MKLEHEHLTWSEIFADLHQEDPGAWVLELALTCIANCEGCRRQVGDLLDMLEAGEIPEDVDLYDLVLIRSRRRARKQWERLKDANLEWTLSHLKRAPAWWGMVELLVKESHSAASSDRDRALALGEAAVQMAERLPTRAPDESTTLLGADEEEPLYLAQRAELLALSHAVVANAYRLRDDALLAGRHFAVAEGYLVDVNPGCLFAGKPRVLSLQGSFLTDRRRLRQAEDVLSEAWEMARDLRPAVPALVAEVSIKLARVHGLLGDSQEAICVLEQVLSAPNEQNLPPGLRHSLRHNLAITLVRTNRIADAERLLPEARHLAAEDDPAIHAPRIRWLEARLALARRDAPQAVAIFGELQAHYADRESPFEVALLAFETALAHHDLGDSAAVQQAAAQAIALLLPLQVAPEALGALALLESHARRSQVQRRTLLALIHWAEGADCPLPAALAEGD